MIEQLPQDAPNGFKVWIIGIFVAGIVGLFAFIKWLVGIQVKKIDTLAEKVNELDGKIIANTTYDKNAKENMIRMDGEITALREKIDGQIIHDINFLKSKLDECKYCMKK